MENVRLIQRLAAAIVFTLVGIVLYLVFGYKP